MHILTNYFDICNSNNGKSINIIIDSKKKQCKTLSDVAKLAYSKSQAIFVDVKYTESDSKKEIDKLRGQGYTLEQAFCKQFEVELAQFLDKKKALRDNYIQSSLPSAFNAKFIPAAFKPASFINSVDEQFLQNIYYNSVQDSIYYYHNNSYTLLASVSELIARESCALYKLATCISEDMAIANNTPTFDFWPYLYEQIDKVTECFFESKLLFETYTQQDKAFTADDKLTTVPWKEQVSMFYFCDKSTHKLLDDWYDRLHSYFIKNIFKYIIPASGVNADLYNVYYEALNDDESTTFKRYAIRPTHGAKCTFETYISKLLSERSIIMKKLKKLDVVPHVISDDSTPAEFVYDTNWLDALCDQVEMKDAKILHAFLDPYTVEERRVLMAWAYTVIHPSTNDNIHLLFMTGGGSFKTNYYCAMIEHILKLAYHSNRKLVHEMKGDKWITDSFLRESSNSGISTAAMINADECTDKCLDQFKEMSGGTIDGMSYQKRMMRENPISMKIYAKWLFTTNKFFSIDDESGAFERRLLIVNRMDVKNIEKPYSASEFNKHIFTEVKAFYECAKLAYQNVMKEAASLQEYRDNTDLKKNMTLAYNEDDKLYVYYRLYEEVSTLTVCRRDKDGRIVVPTDVFNELSARYCEDAGVNLAGFRKWIRSTNSTEIASECKPTRLNDVVCKCWHLSKLTSSTLSEIESQIDDLSATDNIASQSAIPVKTRTSAKFELSDEQQPHNNVLTSILSVEDIRIRNAVWTKLKSTNTNPDTLTAVQIREYINAAKADLADLTAEVESKDDFYSHLKYNPNIQV